MKTSLRLIAFLAASFLFNPSNAQVRICVWCGLNMDVQPKWGPTGYDYVDFYYMPDIDAYYNVAQHQFICQKQGVWTATSSLPIRYGAFDLFKAHKVVINEETPYKRNDNFKADYASFKGQHDQAAIRDSRDPRYVILKEEAQIKGPSHNQLKALRHSQQKEEERQMLAAR
jgi:hypothetical protein